eukprot:2869686-Pyramimonas_sp.AAC.1
MALYLQDQERQIIQHLMNYVKSKGFEIEAIIHDELLLKGRVEEMIDLKEASDYIREKTGFTFQFECKNTKPTSEDLEWFESHKKFISNEEDDEKNLLSFTDFGLAKVMYNQFKNKYVCVSINEKWNWYEFDGNLWKECPKGASLKNHMNNYLYQVICDKIAATAKKCRHLNEKNEDNENDNEINRLQELINKLNKMSKSVRQNARKNAILDECALLFQKPYNEFYEKLDEKPNLIAFNNGVFDLDTNEFRDAKPEDM